MFNHSVTGWIVFGFVVLFLYLIVGILVTLLVTYLDAVVNDGNFFQHGDWGRADSPLAPPFAWVLFWPVLIPFYLFFYLIVGLFGGGADLATKVRIAAAEHRKRNGDRKNTP